MEGLLRITLCIVACAFSIEAQSFHEYEYIETCGDGPHQEDFLITFDDELMAHVDFKEKKDIITMPDFIGRVEFPELYHDAVKSLFLCREVGQVLKTVYANSSEELEAPWSSVFSKNDAELNVKNTLICHVTGFFPPPVTVSWTKNNLNVTDSTLSQYYPNNDGTLNVFSSLSFIPVKGDVYSCTVEHKALEQPQTRIWEVEIREPSIGPLVFCGVGLGFGLLGLATGVFFIVK